MWIIQVCEISKILFKYIILYDWPVYLEGLYGMKQVS